MHTTERIAPDLGELQNHGASLIASGRVPKMVRTVNTVRRGPEW